MISACSYGAKDCQNKYLFFEKEIASFLSHCHINIELKERDCVGNISVLVAVHHLITYACNISLLNTYPIH